MPVASRSIAGVPALHAGELDPAGEQLLGESSFWVLLASWEAACAACGHVGHELGWQLQLLRDAGLLTLRAMAEPRNRG